ncbi:hypothetical protein PENSTE_c002G08075 [Penicillium steckii]|uniref:Uncharacterized protein n=1 Tax=Penicillium steckii TaxID=303698 RepID=A0A1V6TVH7_9EURO|nr:hypothetical protein PENSTE_c002G08075 [Penicillium steckii]
MKLLLLLCATSTLALPIQFAFTGDTPTIRLKSSETFKSAPATISTDGQQYSQPSSRRYVERLRLEHPSSTKGPGPDEKSPAESESPDNDSYLYGRKYGALLGNSSKSNHREQHQASSSSSSSSSSQRYGAFLAKASKFIELHGPRTSSTQSIQSKLDSEPDTSLGRLYGTFLGGMNGLMPAEKHPNAPAKSLNKAPCNYSQHITAYLKQTDVVDLLENHGPECVALAIFVLFPLAYLVLELIERALRYCTREEFPERGRDRVRLIGPERQLRAWSNQQREILLDEKSWWQARRMRSS